MEQDDAAMVALSAGAPAPESRQRDEAEVARLSGVAGGIALAARSRTGHSGWPSAGQHHSTMPNMLGGSPPHPPFFGPHTHVHDHPGGHAHDHSRPDHGHRHVHGDGSPIVDDGLSGRSAGLAAGWPGAGHAAPAAQHFHAGQHEHLHHHGIDGIPDSHHDHHHAEAAFEQPGGDVLRLPGEMGGQEATPAAAQARAADITARNPDLGFMGGRVRAPHSMTWTDPNQVTDTDHRQPSHGGVIHPAVAEVLSRHREIFEPPGPLAELRQQRSGVPLGPLGKPGMAYARTRQGPAGEHPSTR